MPKGTELAKSVASAIGLRVRRAGPENRFDAMADALRLLRSNGYRPRIVIDGGANVGRWTALAAEVFPDAQFHLIEPQPVCLEALRDIAGPARQVHGVALTRPGVRTVAMEGVTGDSRNTGAWIVEGDAAPAGSVEFPAATLDELFDQNVTLADRALLKFDLEGHELTALEGASALLPRIEVLISEVQFFDIEGAGRPTFSDLEAWLRSRGFDLYDIAALASRRRDGRLRMGDAVFVRRDSALMADVRWE